ncbi:glycogen synthase [Porticoccaceae bacterium]|nr:glycogen synthase [Porticoccaceae bacterium]
MPLTPVVVEHYACFIAQSGHSAQTLQSLSVGCFLRAGGNSVDGRTVDGRTNVTAAYLHPLPIAKSQLCCAELFDRPGGPYGETSGHDWEDNAQRFGLFCRIVTLIGTDRAGLSWQPDIVHCNDWHTGLVPLLLKVYKSRPQCVFTIHNLAYQGLFNEADFNALKLPEVVNGVRLWDFRGLEFYRQMSFIKAGIVFAGAVNTVSQGYAQEVLTTQFGCGLEGLLKTIGRRFSGIVNGIDIKLWDPGNDRFIETLYGASSLHRKIFNKLAVQAEFHLGDNNERLLIGMVSRLTEQKGLELILEALPLIQQQGIDFVLLGSGDRKFEQALQEAARRYPGRVSVKIGYDERIAHLIVAGADALLIPSRYEPCGLTQMYAQRYGTVPVAHGVGGLADTIIDIPPFSEDIADATGVLFWDYSCSALLEALQRLEFVYGNLLLWREFLMGSECESLY